MRDGAALGTAHVGSDRWRAVTSLRDNPRFRLLWCSNLFFFGGVWTQTLVLSWLVYEVTRSDLLVAVFAAVRLAPMLLGPFAGVFADRHDRVRLLMLACAGALVTATTVAALATAGLTPYWALLVAGFATGLMHSPSQPARTSLVLELVGRRNLSNANALNAMALNMTQLAGPALGGVMISAFGVAAALWVSAAWYAVSLGTLLPLRGCGHPVGRHTGSTIAMVTAGLRSIVRNRLASAVLLVTVAANVLLWPVYQSFMPVFAQESLGIDAATLGWLLTCAGAGGLVGSLLIAALGDFRFKGGLFVVGTAGWGALWSVFALSHNVTASFVLMGAIGLMSASFGVLQTTLLLLTTDAKMHGRALGMQELAIGVQPVASLALGAVAELVGIDTTTFFSGLILVTIMVTLAVRLPGLLTYGSPRADRDRAT